MNGGSINYGKYFINPYTLNNLKKFLNPSVEHMEIKTIHVDEFGKFFFGQAIGPSCVYSS